VIKLNSFQSGIKNEQKKPYKLNKDNLLCEKFSVFVKSEILNEFRRFSKQLAKNKISFEDKNNFEQVKRTIENIRTFI